MLGPYPDPAPVFCTREQFKSFYLTAYTFVQIAGYIIFYPTVVSYVLNLGYDQYNKGPDASLMGSIGPFFGCMLALSIAEIFHSAFGLVPGYCIFPFLQVTFKNMVFIIFIYLAPKEIRTLYIVNVLLFVWCTADLIRNTFYMGRLFGINLYPLLWLRYNAWIVLYPIGIFAEAYIMYRNLPRLEQSRQYCISLPNALNFSLDVPLLIRSYLTCFVWIGAYLMLSHMARQRSKAMQRSLKSD